VWEEYKCGRTTPSFTFAQHSSSTAETVVLVDASRGGMLVRFPLLDGGAAQWSEDDGEQWHAFARVDRLAGAFAVGGGGGGGDGGSADELRQRFCGGKRWWRESHSGVPFADFEETVETSGTGLFHEMIDAARGLQLRVPKAGGWASFKHLSEGEDGWSRLWEAVLM